VLDMPLRDRHALLLAAGFAPRYSQTRLDAHDPHPGVALDRRWNIVIANAAAQRVAAIVPPELLIRRSTPPRRRCGTRSAVTATCRRC
jgi:hypothetical protein